MKISKRNLVSFFCIILIVFVGCKKYPDGPLLSIYSKEHRIVGTWDVEYFSVDGNDSTAYLKSQLFYGKYKFQDGDYGVGDFLYQSNNSLYTKGGHWIFENKKKNLRLSLQNTIPSNSIGPYGAAGVAWEIRRLKEKELWLKTTYNGKEYFVKFKQ